MGCLIQESELEGDHGRMSGQERVAHFIKKTTWGELPEAVKKRAKCACLITSASPWPGALTPVSKIAADFAAANWGGVDATILLHQDKSSAPGAAFANACAGNGLDLDDDAIFTGGHPGAQLFPAALAAAEKAGAGGKDLLEALVIGYEVSIRAGR